MGSMGDNMINVYGIDTPDQLVINYYKNLVGRIFSLLPSFEGRDVNTKEITFTPEESYEMFKSALENLIIEICGSNALFLVGEKSIKLLSIIRGLHEIQMNEHRRLKSAIFTCTDLCSKITSQLIQDYQDRLMSECNNDIKDGDVNGI